MTELLERIWVYIYRMHLDELSLFAVFAALIFCTCFHRFSDRRWLRPCIRLALAVWFLAVLWMTVFSRSGDGSHRISWIPLHTYWRVICGEDTELVRSSFMNVVLFFPAGLLLGSLRIGKGSFRRGLFWVAVQFALFSIAIELSQYFFRVGYAEVDDVLHNTLGAIAGFAGSRLEVDEAKGKNQEKRWR